MLATRTRVHEDAIFSIRPMADWNTGWDVVEFSSEAGMAYAELQVTRRTTWDDSYERDEYAIWGVKVVDENRKYDESKRGRGLGTALMENLVAHADQHDWNLWLKCEPHNSGDFIVGFYERFGFTILRYEANSAGPQGRIVMMRDRSNT